MEIIEERNRMEIIDVNSMVGNWPAFALRFQDADGLLREMANYRISSTISFHSHALWDMDLGNHLAHTIAQKSQGRIRPCYVLQPPVDSAILPDSQALLAKLRREKPVAVKLFPNTHKYLPDEFYCGELFAVLNELKMPVLFDADQRPAYEALPKLAKVYPNIPFVLLRHPLTESRYMRSLLCQTANVYFDVSILCDTGLLDEVVNRYGSERLVFGSGMPFYVPAGAFGLIFYARISESARENILHANWNRLEGAIQW